MCSNLPAVAAAVTCIAVLFTGCAGIRHRAWKTAWGRHRRRARCRRPPTDSWGQNVRWGGEILACKITPKLTEVEGVCATADGKRQNHVPTVVKACASSPG